MNYKSEEVVKEKSEVFDFRKNNFLQIICDILNCGDLKVMMAGLQELNEYFLYSRPESFDEHTE